MTAITNPSVHILDDSGSGYDQTQTDDEIKNGDVLVIASEGVVGILMKAWPIAIVFDPETGPGAFHVFSADVDIKHVDKHERDESTYTAFPRKYVVGDREFDSLFEAQDAAREARTIVQTIELPPVEATYVIEADPGTDYSASVKLALETARADADVTGNDHWREPVWRVQKGDDEGYAVKEID